MDGLWSSIGTMNFDNRSLALTDEVTLMVLDPDVGQRLDAQFRDDIGWTREITPAAFGERPWTERVGEGIATLLTRLL